MELMKPNGEIIVCNNEVNPEIFKAAQLNLGALGVITTLTFQCEPSFMLHQTTESATLEKVNSISVKLCLISTELKDGKNDQI